MSKGIKVDKKVLVMFAVFLGLALLGMLLEGISEDPNAAKAEELRADIWESYQTFEGTSWFSYVTGIDLSLTTVRTADLRVDTTIDHGDIETARKICQIFWGNNYKKIGREKLNVRVFDEDGKFLVLCNSPAPID